jgi:hypothetical protein
MLFDLVLRFSAQNSWFEYVQEICKKRKRFPRETAANVHFPAKETHY